MAATNRDPWPDNVPEEITMGVISRRIYQTPLIKWVYPARIRDRSKNDVVFVGETFVHLKEWDARTGSLMDVATLDCFSSHISGVAVLGERKTSTELMCTSDSAPAENEVEQQPPQILVLVLGHNQLAFVTLKPDETGPAAFRIHLKPTPTLGIVQETETHIAIDAHARAMAFSNSNKFVVLYGLASTVSHSNISLESLIESEVVLPIDRTILNMDFIHPLREDSEKVILLILGLNDNKFEFDIYMWDFGRLLNAQSVKFHRYPLGKSHGFPLSLIPLKSEIADGCFVVVEEENMLLYRLSTSGSVELTSSICLRDNSLDELKEARDPAVSTEAPLWTNWARPIRNPDWQHEVLYLGREDGLFKYVQIGPSKPTKKLAFEILGSGGNLDCNIDTAMAVLEIDQARRSDNDPVRSESQNFQEGYPDALVVASTSGDGGLYEIGYSHRGSEFPTLSREESNNPHKRVTIPNWAPLYGVAVMRPKTIQTGEISEFDAIFGDTGNVFDAHIMESPDRIFTINGAQPDGAVCELRHGLSVPLSISKLPREPSEKKKHQHEYDLKHCNAVWTIGSSSHGRLMLFSYPWRSVLASVDANTAALSEVMLFEFFEATLDMQLMTVKDPTKQEHAKEDPRRIEELTVLVCVCPTHVRLLSVQSSSSSQGGTVTVTEMQSWNIPNSTSACFGQRDGEFLLATPKLSGDVRSVVGLKRVMLDGLDFKLVSIGKAVEFVSEVSAMTFIVPDVSTSDQPLASEATAGVSSKDQFGAICTVPETIYLGKIHSESGLEQGVSILYGAKNPLDGLVERAIVSITSLHSTQKSSYFNLLCGSRHGVLQILRVRKQGRSVPDSPMTFMSSIRMPPNVYPIRVMRDPTNINSGIVYSENYVSLVEFPDTVNGEPNFSSIYFTDPKDQTFSHGTIDALTHSTNSISKDCLSGCLIAISGGMILAGRRSSTPQALVVRRPVPGTPRKILFSKQWENLVIATTVSKLCSETNKRYSLSTLFRMSPDVYRGQAATQQEIDEYDFATSAYHFPLDERVLDLMEIFLHQDTQVYHFFVATTIMLSDDPCFGNKGRICFFTSQPELTLATKCMEAYPVYAINQTSGGALIYCCGHELNMRVYDAQQKKFIKHKLDDSLLSPGVEIAISGEFIIIATQLHSLIVFRLDEEKREVEKVFTDFRPRDGISTLCLPERGLVLMTCKPNRIAGFWGTSQLDNPTMPGPQGFLRPVFDMVLATGVTHVVKADLRPCWKRFLVPGVWGENLLGTATDGSLFSFNLLTRPAFELLHFVELMCLRETCVCPFPPPDAETRRSFHLKHAGLKDLHVDGHVLLSLLKMLNPEQILEKMLDRQPPLQGIHPLTGIEVDFSSAKHRRSRFTQLVQDVMNDIGAQIDKGWFKGDLNLKEDTASPLFLGVANEAEAVVAYLRLVLRMPM